MARSKFILEVGALRIPVKLVKIVEDNKSDLHMACDTCGGGIKYRYHCDSCGDNEKQPRNKKFESGETAVIITPDEMSLLPLKTSTVIPIEGFTPQLLDVRLQDGVQALVPDDDKGKNAGAIKAFTLLYKAMAAENVKAIGKVSVTDREKLIALAPFRDENGTEVLLAQKLIWSWQVRDLSELKYPEIALSDKELQLGRKLVASRRMEFKHITYNDDYTVALRELITAKVEGRALPAPPPRLALAASDNLEALLSASIKEG